MFRKSVLTSFDLKVCRVLLTSLRVSRYHGHMHDSYQTKKERSFHRGGVRRHHRRTSQHDLSLVKTALATWIF